MGDRWPPFGDCEIEICEGDDAVAEQAIAAGLVKRAEIAKTTKKIGRCVQVASPRGQGLALFSPPAARGVKSPVLRVHVLGADHPPSGPPAAHQTPEKHAASFAANAVVVAGDVTTNPAPHHVLPQCISITARQGKGGATARCDRVGCTCVHWREIPHKPGATVAPVVCRNRADDYELVAAVPRAAVAIWRDRR